MKFCNSHDMDLTRENGHISPETFREILETLSKNEDEGTRHKIADALLCLVLKQNGYGEGLENIISDKE